MVEAVAMGVIGLGKIGRLHAAHLASGIRGARLAAVCDADPATLAWGTAEFGAAGFSTPEELLAQDFVDAVIIASTAETHAAIISAAVHAGKHVFSEKPVALTLEETDRALQQLVDAGLQFQIGFQRRWDAAYVEAKRKIVAGEIGRPLLFTAHGRDPQFTGDLQDPDKSGGIFLDAAIHDYDAARFLMGDEIARLTAHGATLLHERLTALGDVDTCVTILNFRGGAMGIAEWNRCASYGHDVCAEELGSEATLRIGKLQQTDVLVLSRSGVTHDTVPWFAERFAAAYRAEVEAFCVAIRDNSPASPGVEDARIALSVALRARDSFHRGESLDVATVEPLTPRGAAISA